MEKVLYDTNKLIEAYKSNKDIQGYTTIFNLIEFPKALELDLIVLYPSKSDYNLALKISTELLKIGKPVPAIDVIISAISINRGLKLVTKDKHFLFVKDVIKDFNVQIE